MPGFFLNNYFKKIKWLNTEKFLIFLVNTIGNFQINCTKAGTNIVSLVQVYDCFR